MTLLTSIPYYIWNFNEFRAILQWKIWHDAVHRRDPESESMETQICFDFLEKTSRSFSMVIQELHPDLLIPVAIFYLILRGLDTIEDDMTIELAKKAPLLRNFHNILDQKGWKFEDNGPKEKDRHLLMHFNYVIDEFAKIKPAYRAVIKDITDKMGNGMASYASNAEHNVNGVDTIEDYSLYCHYVAGLVGNGLTRLFVESGLANTALLERPHLQESMGQFLQKTNIIRDIREDWEDHRRFWPKEIWSKHVVKFDDLFDPAHQESALNCSSEMVLNALAHADECLFYLAGIKEQSVFNFAAIPQTMAIATLALVFRNPNIFKKNVKISKGLACQMMVKSTQNLRVVCEAFREMAREIHKKNTPKDPNFLQISVACGKIEQFIESIHPTQDPRAIARRFNGEKSEERGTNNQALWDVLYLFGAVGIVLFFILFILFGVAFIFGSKVDIDIIGFIRDIMGNNTELIESGHVEL